MVQDIDILCSEGLFFLSILLKILKQGIGSSICFALIIIDFKMVLRKFLSSANLSGAQTFYIHKLPKVLMIDKYENFMLRAF